MWSKRYQLNQCRECSRDTIPHKANGLCKTCYERAHNYVWQKTYQHNNRDKSTAYNKKWVAANPSVVKRSKKRWSDTHCSSQRRYIRNWRRRNKAPFCIICGESRVAEWAHLIPHKSGGPAVGWNLIPLCPTHHLCFDRSLLNTDEFAIVLPHLVKAREQHEGRALVEGVIVGTHPSSL